jgi:hypothetical protein
VNLHSPTDLPCDLALLQELLCVQGVECAQVVDHCHQFTEDGGLIRVLGQQDAAQYHLKLVLHSLKQFWIAQARPI